MASRWKKTKGAIKSLAHAANVLKTIPHGVDSSTFLGSSIAPEIRASVPIMHQTPAELVVKLIDAAVDTFKSGNAPDVSAQFEEFSETQDDDDFGTLFSGLYSLLTAAITHHTKLSVIQTDLTAMNLPSAVIQAFVTAVRTHRFDLEDAAAHSMPRFPKIARLRWRVDVTISTNSVSRVLRPSILMQLTLSDGVTKTFECPVDKFHELRYSVARMLRDMRALDSHPVMRIAYDMEKQKLDEEGKGKTAAKK